MDMAILDVKVIPDPILRVVTSPVETFDSTLHKLLDDMFDTMIASNGIGLAAPQVGSSLRLAITEFSIEGFPTPIVTSLSGKAPESHVHENRLELINPVVISTGSVVSSDEGCLSIPDYRDSIKRPATVTISCNDRHGNLFKVEAEDLPGFCIQHEIDHLNGILFVDHLSRLKKQLFKRWCSKHGVGFQERV